MRLRFAWKAAVAAAISFCTALATAQEQQYQVYSWDSFEDATLSAKVKLGHLASPDNVHPLPLQGSSIAPAVFGPTMAENCGLRALMLKPDPKTSPLSMVALASLQRSKLGTEGRALYQYDLYLPPDGEIFPNTALLAISSDEYEKNPKSTKMYRFGVTEGGGRCYFSYMDGSADPKIYLQQKLAEFKLKRPGWHRFQFIFRGQEEITLAIDGKPTSFSPVKEPTITRMNPGVMVVSAMGAKKDSGVTILDNLSIQWSPDEAPLPESPWTKAESAPHASASLLEANPSLTWRTDPSAAYREATQQGKPLLVLFYMPRVKPYQYLMETVPNTPEARDLLAKYVLLRIDANQLEGGTLAQRFRVTRVPSFLTLAKDGKEAGRLTITTGTTKWPEIAAYLQKTP